jgi:hypothetical protein
MKSDRILDEVWKAKDALGKRFGYDVHRLAEHFRRPEEPAAEHRKVKNGRAKGKAKQLSAKHNGNGHAH